MSCPNAVKPLQLGWNNITVNSEGTALTNGIAVQLGSPSQARRRILAVANQASNVRRSSLSPHLFCSTTLSSITSQPAERTLTLHAYHCWEVATTPVPVRPMCRQPSTPGTAQPSPTLTPSLPRPRSISTMSLQYLAARNCLAFQSAFSQMPSCMAA